MIQNKKQKKNSQNFSTNTTLIIHFHYSKSQIFHQKIQINSSIFSKFPKKKSLDPFIATLLIIDISIIKNQIRASNTGIGESYLCIIVLKRSERSIEIHPPGSRTKSARGAHKRSEKRRER